MSPTRSKMKPICVPTALILPLNMLENEVDVDANLNAGLSPNSSNDLRSSGGLVVRNPKQLLPTPPISPITLDDGISVVFIKISSR